MKLKKILTSLLASLSVSGIALLASSSLAQAQTTTYSSTTGWVMELSGSSHTAIDSLYKDSVYFGSGDYKADMMGGDIAIGYMAGSSGGFIFTLGGALGDFTSTSTYHDGIGFVDIDSKADLTMGHAMVGYRYSYKLSSSISIYAGAHIGLSTMSIDAPSYIVTSPSTGQLTSLESNTADDFGYVYAFETGLTLHLSQSFYIFASYLISSSTATPELKLRTGEEITMEEQSYQTIRVGLGFTF